MAKREVIKKPRRNIKIIPRPNRPITTITKPRRAEDVNKILVENFVSLQKVMTNLSVKFDNLSTQISKLLELFEISAKTLAEKNPGTNMEGKGGDFEGKLDNLIEQNRVIARGLTLLHEVNPSPQVMRPPQRPSPMQPPRNPQIRQMPRQTTNVENYQKSISSKPKREDEREI
tara:strand:- start:2320 stop:2838 length:519 start_codon:yes stop_codon:yes gene_type:complete